MLRDPWTSYDQWKTSPPEYEEEVVFHCDHCGGDVFLGDEYIYTTDGRVHDECFADYAWDILEGIYREAEREW